MGRQILDLPTAMGDEPAQPPEMEAQRGAHTGRARVYVIVPASRYLLYVADSGALPELSPRTTCGWLVAYLLIGCLGGQATRAKLRCRTQIHVTRNRWQIWVIGPRQDPGHNLIADCYGIGVIVTALPTSTNRAAEFALCIARILSRLAFSPL